MTKILKGEDVWSFIHTFFLVLLGFMLGSMTGSIFVILYFKKEIKSLEERLELEIEFLFLLNFARIKRLILEENYKEFKK